MDSNYKRETIIYIIFLMFIIIILFGLPIYMLNIYMDDNNFLKKTGTFNLLKQFIKLTLIILFISIFIILIFV